MYLNPDTDLPYVFAGLRIPIKPKFFLNICHILLMRIVNFWDWMSRYWTGSKRCSA